MRIMIWIALLGASATAADTANPKALTVQQVAQHRADWMIQHNARWHAPGRIANVWRVARFEGCGWGRPGAQHQRIGTCQPRGRRYRVVADAYAANGRMSVRVRLWR